MELDGKSSSLLKTKQKTKNTKEAQNLGKWHSGIPERVGRVL